MRRILVVANETLGGAELRKRLVLKRSTDPDLELFLLVPATPSAEHVGAPTATNAGGLPAPGMPAPSEPGSTGDAEAVQAATKRVEVELAALRALNFRVDGAVGDPDPMTAVRSLLAERRFDAIVVSTLPTGPSRWLRMDLPHRLARATKLPVDHIIGEEPGLTDEPGPALEFPGVPAAAAGGQVEVLLVEDNNADAELTRLALSRCSTPNSVHTVGNGAEAVEWLRAGSSSSEVHLVLVDLKMPVVDGFELLEVLGNEHKLESLAVVVLTNSDRMEDRERAHALGAHAYITKEAFFPLYCDVLEGLLAEVAASR